MKKLSDLRDVLIFLLVTGGWVAATIFLFKYPAEANFATWAATCTTITGVYHWIVFKDDKEKDSCQPS